MYNKQNCQIHDRKETGKKSSILLWNYFVSQADNTDGQRTIQLIDSNHFYPEFCVEVEANQNMEEYIQIQLDSII